MSLSERFSRYLEELRQQGRYRQLAAPAGIDFSSNDYLGLGKRSEAPPFAAGRSGQASRLLRGEHERWQEVEDRLARWHKAECALIMTSGYTANEGLLATLLQPG